MNFSSAWLLAVVLRTADPKLLMSRAKPRHLRSPSAPFIYLNAKHSTSWAESLAHLRHKPRGQSPSCCRGSIIRSCAALHLEGAPIFLKQVVLNIEAATSARWARGEFSKNAGGLGMLVGNEFEDSDPHLVDCISLRV